MSLDYDTSWNSSREGSPFSNNCIEFKPPGGGGSGEPRPKPDPRGMDELFPRPERQSRMFVQPQEVSVS